MIATAAPDDAAWSAAVRACPKHMAHGPCAGVGGDDLACEVPGAGTCSYVDIATSRWPYPSVLARASAPDGSTPAAQAFLATVARRQVVVVDLPSAPLSSPALLASAAELAAADALLTGDHGGARLQFPPSYRAKLLVDHGYPVWVGINCRDRNRVALEAEIAAVLDAGATGVHCITGDHTALGDRPDALPVFDLDAVDVVRLASARGALTSVAHAPLAPPAGQRVPRLLAKAAAGADCAFVDHCGGPDAVAGAVRALRAGGFTGLIIACVPVVVDAESAAVLESFALGRLPDGYVDGIVAAADPATAGIIAATALCDRLLDVDGLDGVDLSCGSGPGTEFALARHLGEIGRLVVALAEAKPRPRSVEEAPS